MASDMRRPLTVGELIELLKLLPDDHQVFVRIDGGMKGMEDMLQPVVCRARTERWSWNFDRIAARINVDLFRFQAAIFSSPRLVS